MVVDLKQLHLQNLMSYYLENFVSWLVVCMSQISKDNY